MISLSSLRRPPGVAVLLAASMTLVSCQAPTARPQNFREVLRLGTHRADVLATLGDPVETFEDHDNTVFDSMRIEHGRGTGARAAVGAARWVGGIATLGLTEAVFKDAPPEPVSFKVFYGSDKRITRVEPSNERAREVFERQRVNSSRHYTTVPGTSASPAPAGPPSSRSARPN